MSLMKFANVLSPLSFAAAAAFVLVAAGCPTSIPKIVDPGPVTSTCIESTECPPGNVCSGGTCTIGVCDPALETACDGATAAEADKGFCCKPWERCNGASFTCENDPAVHGIGCDPNDP